jgi:nitroreductase
MSLRDALKWRYAPKRMTGQTVPESDIDAIIEAARMAPTSMGLQPFSLLLVRDKILAEQLAPIAYNQPQIREASHLLIFAAYTELSLSQIDRYLENIMVTRGVSAESLQAFRNSMVRFQQQTGPEQLRIWAQHQAYLALGFALAEAALLRVDVTPMEGFDPLKLDQFFGLQERGLHSVAMLAIGYRDEDQDFLAGAKKVRRSKEELVVRFYD